MLLIAAGVIASALASSCTLHILPPPPPAAPGEGPAASDAIAAQGTQRVTQSPAGSLQEDVIGEAAELKPAITEVMLPQPDLDQPPTTPEPASLVQTINTATPPNVAAALRLIDEGRQARDQGRHDQALERFERAVAIDPTNAYGYYFLAQLHYINKNYDQALAFSSRAATLSARNDRICLGRVYSLQGAVFEEVGRYPDARKAYRSAVDADPNNLSARVGAARLAPEHETLE
jgi:Flp pilus assembly protein TadD